MQQLTAFFDRLSGIVWGPVLITLLLGTGLYLTIRLKAIQFTRLGYALRIALLERKSPAENPQEEGDISPFQALMTALSATIGTGNIVGVTTALYLGGPGAVFWMWISALVGMATKYSEAILAVHYRIKTERGEMAGGPMYYLSLGFKQRWLALLFCFFTIMAAFGMGAATQSNSIAKAINTSFGIPTWLTAVILMVATAAVTLGGIKSIGRVAEFLVPFMALFYIAGSILILALNFRAVPAAFASIFRQAFSYTAPMGGFAGATVAAAIRRGVSRGVFSNESGLGSAPIAAAAARTDSPARQALVSMTGAFIDTIVVCTMTALVVLSSGLWTSGLRGPELVTAAYQQGLPGLGGYIVSIGLVFFAYSTIIGWAFYGEKASEFLWGQKAIVPFRLLHVVGVGLGAIANLTVVWSFADVMNGLMAFPNLIGLLGLSGIVVRETRSFWKHQQQEYIQIYDHPAEDQPSEEK